MPWLILVKPMVDISYLKPLSQACITLYLLQNFGLHIQQKQLLATLVYILEIPHHKIPVDHHRP